MKSALRCCSFVEYIKGVTNQRFVTPSCCAGCSRYFCISLNIVMKHPSFFVDINTVSNTLSAEYRGDKELVC